MKGVPLRVGRCPGGANEGTGGAVHLAPLVPSPLPLSRRERGSSFYDHSILIWSYLSHWLVSERITWSPALRPRTISTRSTEAAPMRTGIRVAVWPDGS